MVLVCSARGCSNKPSKSSSLSFHKFPSNPVLLEKWLTSLNTQNWRPTKNSKLCSAHFLKTDFYIGLEHSRLKDYAVPSQNLSTNRKLRSREIQDHSYVSSMKRSKADKITPSSTRNISIKESCSISDAIENNSCNQSTPTFIKMPIEELIDSSEIVWDEGAVKSDWNIELLERVDHLENENAELRRSKSGTESNLQSSMESLQSWNTALLSRVLSLEKRVIHLEAETTNLKNTIAQEKVHSFNKSMSSNNNCNSTNILVDHRYAASPESLKQKMATCKEKLKERQRELARALIKK